jgi:hypothetical protein
MKCFAALLLYILAKHGANSVIPLVFSVRSAVGKKKHKYCMSTYMY